MNTTATNPVDFRDLCGRLWDEAAPIIASRAGKPAIPVVTAPPRDPHRLGPDSRLLRAVESEDGVRCDVTAARK